MKQTFSILMAMVAMILFSTGCDKNSLVEQNPSGEVKMQTVTISAGISNDAQTKTAIGGLVAEEVDGVTKTFRKVVWKAGDKIGVTAQDADGNTIMKQVDDGEGGLVDSTDPMIYEFTLTSGMDTEKGEFEGELPDVAGVRIKEAFYPYLADGTATIKTEQTATPGSFDETVALMQATRNAADSLVFSHKAAYIKITPSDYDYKQIAVSLTDSENITTSYTIKNEGGAIAKDTTYYIAVPGSDNYTSLSLCCYVDDTRCYTRTSKKSINLSNGKILSIPEITLNDLRANGHAFVDLGLPSGNLWATCNIGAETEYKYGHYFAWAETTQRQVSENDPTFGWDTTPYWDVDNSTDETQYFTKYSSDSKTTLELEDDAAHVNWGGDWRMPTKEDFEELLAHFPVENRVYKTNENASLDFYGVYLYSPSGSDKYLYFPLSGFYNAENPTTQEYNEGGCGRYWSSSLSDDSESDAMYLLFPREDAINEYDEEIRVQPDCRFYGHTIRAVMSKFTPAQ